MAEGITIHFKYQGPAVADGTMPLTDVASALAGFVEAYAKVAAKKYPDATSRLRLSALETGSFELV